MTNEIQGRFWYKSATYEKHLLERGFWKRDGKWYCTCNVCGYEKLFSPLFSPSNKRFLQSRTANFGSCPACRKKNIEERDKRLIEAGFFKCGDDWCCKCNVCGESKRFKTTGKYAGLWMQNGIKFGECPNCEWIKGEHQRRLEAFQKAERWFENNEFVHTEESKQLCPEAIGHFCMRWGDHGQGGFCTVDGGWYVQGGQPMDEELGRYADLFDCYEDFEKAREKGDSAGMRAAVRELQEVRKVHSITQEYERQHRDNDSDDTPIQNSLTIQKEDQKSNNKTKVYSTERSSFSKALGWITFLFATCTLFDFSEPRDGIEILLSFFLLISLICHQYGLRKGGGRVHKKLLEQGFDLLIATPVVILMGCSVWFSATVFFVLRVMEPIRPVNDQSFIGALWFISLLFGIISFLSSGALSGFKGDD